MAVASAGDSPGASKSWSAMPSQVTSRASTTPSASASISSGALWSAHALLNARRLQERGDSVTSAEWKDTDRWSLAISAQLREARHRVTDCAISTTGEAEVISAVSDLAERALRLIEIRGHEDVCVWRTRLNLLDHLVVDFTSVTIQQDRDARF